MVVALARRQHGVVARSQLLRLGLSPVAIKHRVRKHRLYRVRPGIYAVGTGELSRRGRWMAALLAAGTDAVLSHDTALMLWGLEAERDRAIHLSLPVSADRRPAGTRVHRVRLEAADVTRRELIPVTRPARTLLDLAGSSGSRDPESRDRRLEAAVNAADALGLISADALRGWVDGRGGQRGVAALRRLLEAHTLRLTESELERRFLRLVREAGLPLPETQVVIAGYRVDFLWRDARLVVETDGLTSHRTPAQQAKDHRRDRSLSGAGYTCLRFTHAEVVRTPDAVARELAAAIAGCLARRAA
jgi:very-short-patch-repair endonuclease